jgi:hypothetical protein
LDRDNENRSARMKTAEVETRLLVRPGQEVAWTTYSEHWVAVGYPVQNGAEPEKEVPEVEKLCRRVG